MSAKSFLIEMEQEFVSTKNLLDILPENRLHYKPHEKAMSLGQLAFHIATIPSRNLRFAKDGQVETEIIVEHPIPSNKAEILDAFEKSITSVRILLNEEDTSWLKNDWKLLKSQNPIAEMSTYAFIRTFVLNHWYHHRGELTTYLRILDKRLPSIYGPTADVNPFA
ncbi:putative damage-inducible protein DinB [Aquimarina sp. MAR_2010_214]|uniref:DinB family protein n=1 Tax=Aquimarina sp. MAR_2010_214 TaxID=1250026 RepID=UPI000C6FF6BA|nr:DinB family protein [Aquimarina sp. MAR_2010_214]PKV51856.1 putative damage-inducible protein DinB [Aquimarina sp. MAR_2010_214]